MRYLTVPRLTTGKLPIHSILFIICISCSDEPAIKERDEELLQFRDAFVIGFDQCARYHGRIFAITSPPDTVIAYNFPDSVYHFPEEYYSNYLFDCLFPKNVLDKYPIKIKFRPAEQREFSAYICFSNIYIARLGPLVKNKQVVITSVEK